jgi:hypothetical protein
MVASEDSVVFVSVHVYDSNSACIMVIVTSCLVSCFTVCCSTAVCDAPFATPRVSLCQVPHDGHMDYLVDSELHHVVSEGASCCERNCHSAAGLSNPIVISHGKLNVMKAGSGSAPEAVPLLQVHMMHGCGGPRIAVVIRLLHMRGCRCCPCEADA